jgi:hypothetical protein
MLFAAPATVAYDGKGPRANTSLWHDRPCTSAELYDR